MKSILVFIIFVIIVVGFLFLVPGKQYVPVPGDDLHNTAGDIASCMKCHGPGQKNELKKTHPPKYECFKCHRRGKA